MGKTTIDGLSDAIMDAMMEYREVSEEAFRKVAEQVAKEGTAKLKTLSPRGSGSRKGHYADGWTFMAIPSRRGQFKFSIYNRKKPGLTHLLENGHALRQGGRARAFKHIKKVEQWCIDEFEKRTAEMLNK